ncbi:hypothetical protein [Pseudomonas sp. 24 E 13]|uniref:hypothetical protein n=1 Tax=unclassified Pseudomonas TaxID=196821 RepID=UPI000811DFDA|nr:MULTISPECIES: hypothetical protein [unclassified Pseudomonas]MCL9800739.1 hypothetical protein [Pseudomonas sp. AKS31]CRM76413.1 hypothetical protein [Pseudomonas sp. 24 E 13]
MKSMLVLIPLLTGCSGAVYTVPNPKIDADGRIKGVLVYGYQVVDKKTSLDRIRNPKTGEITHSAYKKKGTSEYCEPDARVDRVAVADYSKPYAVQYDQAWFEAAKFSVTLDKGMLASVGTESTPGPKTAVESLQALASLREDVLNGYVVASSKATNQTMLENFEGVESAETPIRCSSSE